MKWHPSVVTASVIGINFRKILIKGKEIEFELFEFELNK